MTVPRIAAVLALLAFSVCAQPTSKILGGEEILTVEGMAYVASVRLDATHLCGGSIINNLYILTAAHCVVENGKTVAENRLSARIGSTNQFAGGKIVYVYSVFVHPGYKDWADDIALLKLSSPLTWTDKIGPIPIASSAADLPAVSEEVAVAGWGDQGLGEAPYKLAAASYKVASEGDCTAAYSANDETIICLAHALKEGACTGDAGNGGIYKGKLVAMGNFVIGACGARYPDIYLNVAHYADWINGYLI